MGKILIVNKLTGDVIGWFRDGQGPEFNNICLVELDINQYNELFAQMTKMEDLKMTDIENKILVCNTAQ